MGMGVSVGMRSKVDTPTPTPFPQVSGPDMQQSFTFITDTVASKRQWIAGFLNQAANRFLQQMYVCR